MANKTYLELVNNVLIRLREDQVGSVTENAYSTLIGQWVNDAKEMVESAWDWRILTRFVEFSLSAGVTEYYLDDAATVGSADDVINEKARMMRNARDPRLPLAFDITSGDPFQLLDLPTDYIRELYRLTTPVNSQAKPINFSFWQDQDGPKIQLWEYPTATRNWGIYFCCPQDDLTGDSQELLIPWRPVVQIVTEIALNERGEEVGEPGTTVEQRKRQIIADAVAIDAAEQDDKVTFYPS